MKKSIILIIIIILLFVAVFFGYNYLSKQYAPVDEPGASSSSVSDTSGEESTPAEVQQTADFTVINAAGDSVKLSESFGKPIIVNFWASWCGYCKLEFPDFEEAYGAHGEDIVFMMVNTGDNSVEAAVTFAEDNGYTFPIYYDSEYSASRAYAVSGIPVTLFINADGSLHSQKTGMISAETLNSEIEAILGSAE